ncbi:MAG: tRNA (guanosine(37)-N1)-methyltransferase TrmD [Acidipila sp.]|nr:tRNA (guanosine(37)-N1)-methyltransferase TrmD [Acidipila sp.]
MRFDIVTIFPDFFTGPLDHGILRRARETGLAQVQIHDLRASTHDRHRTVDDRPFGGGEGMVLKPEPLFEAVEGLLGAPRESLAPGTAIVLLSASGRLFRQHTARRFAALEHLVLLCGRYEGVDERVAEHLATDEISVGDFVVSGGELPAAMIIDAVTRLLPGALGNEASSINESFSESFSAAEPVSAALPGNGALDGAAHIAAPEGEPRYRDDGILDCPHYTRPQIFRGWEVPEVLGSGHHQEIRRWRRRVALAKTLRNRPELLASAALTPEDLKLLDEIRGET